METEVTMQSQRGLKPNSVHTRFVLGVHPIIEHFIGSLKIREIVGTYVRSDRRMVLGHDRALMLLIHNILTAPNAGPMKMRSTTTIGRNRY